MTYIVINTKHFPTDTVDEIVAAGQALRDANLESAPVWTGEDMGCPDSYQTDICLYA